VGSLYQAADEYKGFVAYCVVAYPVKAKLTRVLRSAGDVYRYNIYTGVNTYADF